MALGFYFDNECEESWGKFLREVKDNYDDLDWNDIFVI
jgi:hypothetical protein